MADDNATSVPPGEEAEGQAEIEGGSYDVLKNRLLEQGRELGRRTDALNTRRKEVFGGTELTVIGNERIRTENNCVPSDILSVGDLLLLGYNVFIGLKSETSVSDVFCLHRFAQTEDGFDFGAVPLEEAGGFLTVETFDRELRELYQYYKETRLAQLRQVESKLLAVFQTGASVSDVKVFRWGLGQGHPKYIDNRGERDHVFPPSHDFTWKPTSREDHVAGVHPHVSLLDEVFVETVGGDLTVKVEDNTEDGQGLYREPVEDADQALDDAQIHYAKVGRLILFKVLPYRELKWRHFVFSTQSKTVARIDAVGQACVSLPEDHGIIFPGGYYLQSGERKVFEGDTADLEYQQVIKSPNGEDVLYVFLRRSDGHYVLFPYNLIRKEVQNPINCHGYCLFDDGKMVVFRAVTDEPARVHPLQIWQTPFTSVEYAAAAPTDGSYLSKVGNADLVRGISEAYSTRRLTENQEPTRQTYEDIIRGVTRLVDAFYWLEHEETGDLLSTLKEISKTAELIVDEFEKVLAIRQRSDEALITARERQQELKRLYFRPEEIHDVDAFMVALTALRQQRGRLITLREMRYIDVEAVDALEQETIERFDAVSEACVGFLLTDEALRPLTGQIERLLGQIEEVSRAAAMVPLVEKLEALSEGLNILSEIAGGLESADATARTQILEGISEVFGQLNRVRATMEVRRKEILSQEGRAEFAAQFKLLSQAVDSALTRADTPESCDEQLSRLMLQLEEIESRFSEFDEFIAELTTKREEIYEAFTGRKQTLVEQLQRRAQQLVTAAERILTGVARRARTFKDEDDLNTYFASDPMLLKLRDLIERLAAQEENVKADELASRVKASRQDALRLLRDRSELFEEGENIIKLGRHRFSVNTQPLELTMVPREAGMGFHLSGTDFYQDVEDEAFAATRPFWDQTLVSEDARVSRAEYLAASILFGSEAQEDGLTLERLQQAALGEGGGLAALVREQAQSRYDEGYERGVHDADATLLLEKLMSLRSTTGLLRFAPGPRALACLFWTFCADEEQRVLWHRTARSLGRLRATFVHSPAIAELATQLTLALVAFCEEHALPCPVADTRIAGQYLVEELMLAEHPTFTTSAAATSLRDALLKQLSAEGTRQALDDDLARLQDRPAEAHALATAWIEAFVARRSDDPAVAKVAHARKEAVALLVCGDRLDRQVSSALAEAEVEGLLGQHGSYGGGKTLLRLDEFLDRLGDYVHDVVPRYRAYRKLRQSLIERQRELMRLEEFKPKVLTSFVRNKLINEVYLPMIGDNLAKQLGALGAEKRTDLMGMLLLVSPPGYGKTTLMEYLASQLGLVFMKINGPSLGHSVTSLDPSEVTSATARQEVEKINLAFEMGNNVMLYLDDIQHTNSELLQKFISLCDAQRRIEGVWNGRTRTYDLRGKKFCVVMAGNPYTESGEKFQIPDMLANRADTYNLGDILEGKDHLFALSYIENALTSNSTLAPLAGRPQKDVYLLIRMARGEDLPATDLSHPYSAVEINDLTQVFKHLFKAQGLLLTVNQQYITSAAQDDAYRTEPPFQLQGSYRNMSKLAEKIVPAMNEEELAALLKDHYQGESQTLTSGAEQNLLKLGELRGTLDQEEAARWEEIRSSFQRTKRLGGSEDDPAVRVVGQLNDIGERLLGIREGLTSAVEAQAADAREAEERAATRTKQARTEAQAAANHRATEAQKAAAQRAAEARAAAEATRQGDQSTEQLAQALTQLQVGLAKLQQPKLDVEVHTKLPSGVTDLLDQQVALVERILNPLVHTMARSIKEGDSIRMYLMALIDDLKRIDQRLKMASPEELKRLRESQGSGGATGGGAPPAGGQPR
jgi:ATPase involved in DNA repair/ATPase family associated with various cellular activities (AAA)